MNAIIEVKQVKAQDFQLLKDVLNNYVSMQKTLSTIMSNPRNYMKDLSIAVEMWYEFNKKTAGQTVPENSTLKLSLHRALVLLDALLEFRKQASTIDGEISRCIRFATAIDEQIPTATQLIA
ncbi:hypothetical protein RM549_06135 [Salegentibacter sp. F188]|uniref:Uncharacterized protein n=1 Tax=Autumnicola patrickiae TaxID=3075591 RepID=A0ABU3E054_9FLAO|nr:hypothetical protein [Salegentibacter sp. F188]MDT0689356.1 hypothetical protein [Salegentibacter sp. F188]